MPSIIGDKRLTAWLRTAGYIAIIASIIVFVVWAYLRHHRTPKPEPGPLVKKERPPLVIATWDNRFTFVDEREFFAPPAFPWSMSSIGQAPYAEITFVTIISEPTPVETGEPTEENFFGTGEETPDEKAEDTSIELIISGDYNNIIRNAMLERAPSLAMPFELDASPPYLVVPVDFTLDLVLGPDGLVKSATVRGDIDEGVRVRVAEKAADMHFPSVLAWFDFRCGVRLTPSHYDRIIGTRGGHRLPEVEYRLLLRALQYGTAGFAETVSENAPELLQAGNVHTVEFIIDDAGHPTDTVIKPIILEPASEKAVLDAIAAVNFPPQLAGANVVLVVGTS